MQQVKIKKKNKIKFNNYRQLSISTKFLRSKNNGKNQDKINEKSTDTIINRGEIRRQTERLRKLSIIEIEDTDGVDGSLSPSSLSCDCVYPCVCSHYKNILKATPEEDTQQYFYAHYALGVTAQTNENYKLASMHLVKALKINPNDANTNLHLAQVLNKMNDMEGAIYHYKQAVKASNVLDGNTKDTGTMSILHRDLAECLQQLAVQEIRINSEKESINVVDKTTTSSSATNTNASSTTKEDHKNNNGITIEHKLLQKIRVDASIKNYSTASIYDPDMKEPHMHLMQHYFETQNDIKAKYHYNELNRIFLHKDRYLTYDLDFVGRLSST